MTTHANPHGAATVWWLVRCCSFLVYIFLFTGSIAYLSYSEGDFEVFCPTGMTHRTDGDEIWHKRVTCQISSQWCKDRVWNPKTENFTKILLNFGILTPDMGVSLARFLQNLQCFVCSAFPDALAVKIWMDLLKGLWSYGVFKLRELGNPNFQHP